MKPSININELFLLKKEIDELRILIKEEPEDDIITRHNLKVESELIEKILTGKIDHILNSRKSYRKRLELKKSLKEKESNNIFVPEVQK